MLRNSLYSSQELVPGDIVLLEAGDYVPADGRVIRISNVESYLEGDAKQVNQNQF